jgi:hypothetical protein
MKYDSTPAFSTSVSVPGYNLVRVMRGLLCPACGQEFSAHAAGVAANGHRVLICTSCHRDVIELDPTEPEQDADYLDWLRSEMEGDANAV